MTNARKLLDLDALLALRAQARKAGKTLVHCHGCFDIVHPGHIHHLEHARSLGDLLVVTVSSDANVNKGVNRPLIPDDLRAHSLAALECVDAVYLNPHPTAFELLQQLKPDIYVKGREYQTNADPRFIKEQHAVIENGGRVVFTGGEVIYSSTALINQLTSTRMFDDEKVRRFRQQHKLGLDTLRNAIQSMQGLRVLVIGDYVRDRYHFCEAMGVCGEAPMMSLRSHQQIDYHGGAAIIAQHVRAMGASPVLFSDIATDAEGEQSRMELAGLGLDLSIVRARRQSICKERFLVEQTKTFRVEQGAPQPLDTRHELEMASLILDEAQDADAAIFADFGYGTITPGLLARVLPELRQRVDIITADVSGPQANLLNYVDVDLVCPTEREARTAIGDHVGGLDVVATQLLQRIRSRRSIITLGRQGLVAFESTSDAPPAPGERLRSDYLPALIDHAIDPLGCGDALLAAATCTLAGGHSLATAAFIGTLAAAIEAQHLGNIPVGTADLIDRISAVQAGPGMRKAS